MSLRLRPPTASAPRQPPRRFPTRVGALLVALTGCRAAPPEPSPFQSDLQPSLVEFFGTLLEGPVPDREPPDDADPGDAFAVRCEMLVVAGSLSDELDPLALHSRLVIQSPAMQLLVATPMVAREARVGSGPDGAAFLERVRAGELGSVFELAPIESALPRDVTLELGVGDAPRTRAEVRSVATNVSLFAGRRDTDLEAPIDLAVLVGGELVRPRTVAPTGAEDLDQQSIEWVRERLLELVLIHSATMEHFPFVVTVPSPYSESDETIVMSLTVSPPPPHSDAARWEAHVARAESCTESVARNADEATLVALRRTFSSMHEQRWQDATLALEHDAPQRTAIAYLAQLAQAPLAADVALIGDEALVKELAGSFVGAQVAQAVVAASAEAGDGKATAPDDSKNVDVGWPLERQAVLSLARRLQTGELPPEVDALLLLHAGQAGEYPGTLEALAMESASRDEFRGKLIDANIDLLESRAPGARVRAYDWLERRGVSIEGYDPLDEETERYKSIHTFLENRGR